MKKIIYMICSLLLLGQSVLTAQSHCNARFSFYIYSSYNLHFYPLHTDTGATYSWTFGDSTSSKDVYPRHTFTHSGRFHVCLTITDTMHKCSSTWCDSVSVSASSACYAVYKRIKDSTGAVLFTPGKHTYTSYYWTFGDSTYSTDVAPKHTYAHAGLHYACLRVADTSLGCTNTWCDTITAGGSSSSFKCNAHFAFYVYGTRQLHFYTKSTSKYTSYSWTFSDTTTSSSPYPIHTFTHDGRFKVCLTVSDTTHHCSDTWCDSVTISTKCNAEFTMYKDSAGDVHCLPKNTGYTYYTWTFDDSSSYSVDKYAKHTYKHSGIHYVCLNVSDTATGCTNKWCDTITAGGGSSTFNCNARFRRYVANGRLNYFFPTSTYSYTSYAWSFGDSGTSATKSTSHTYKHDGRFNVCLTVSDSIHHCSNTWCDSLNISTTCDASFKMYKDTTGTVHFGPTVHTYTTYYWSFGDSTTSTDVYPRHKFKHAGLHHICLYTGDTTLGCKASWCDTISTGGGGGTTTCNAKFAHYVLSTRQLHFYPLSTSKYTSYSWTFSDTTTSKDEYPKHTFTHNGRFKVCLTVIDTIHHCSDTWCDSVSVSTSCNAAFTSYKDSAGTLHFVPAVKTYNAYYWTFGDSAYSLDMSAHHSYKHSGKYYVCLRVGDTTLGCTALWCDTVTSGTVTPCIASFKIDSIDTVHHVIHVTDNSTGQVSHTWIFGDTTHSSTDTATHHYKTGGKHRLCLYIKCYNGTYAYACDTINGDAAYAHGKHGGLFTLKLSSAASTDLADVVRTSTLQVYPNPVLGILTIATPADLDKGELTVHDILGREVFSENFNRNTDNHVDTRAWPPGIYILQLVTSRGNFSTRIIKQ